MRYCKRRNELACLEVPFNLWTLAGVRVVMGFSGGSSIGVLKNDGTLVMQGVCDGDDLVEGYLLRCSPGVEVNSRHSPGSAISAHHDSPDSSNSLGKFALTLSCRPAVSGETSVEIEANLAQAKTVTRFRVVCLPQLGSTPSDFIRNGLP